jgi:NAD(P)-dependent dehydrogenase (short-subunit alcohol dehydrogenase family)
MEDKVAVITGGARGVGFGIAQEIIAAGGTAVIVDLNPSDVDQAVAQLGERSSGLVADVTNLDAMEAMYDELIARHGHLNAVVANAGVGNSAPLRSPKNSSTSSSASMPKASFSQFRRHYHGSPRTARWSSSAQPRRRKRNTA